MSGQTQKSFAAAAAKIERLSKDIKHGVGSGLRIIGEQIMLDVKISRPGAGVPLDTGALRSTGVVEGPNGAGQVSLSFGGTAAPYALYQHEVTELHHRLGESRYLVRGLERWKMNGASVKSAMAAMVTRHVQKNSVR